jgi:hypothetical protein
LGYGYAGRRPAVHIEELAVGLSPEFHAPNITKPRDASAIAGFAPKDNVLELSGV